MSVENEIWFLRQKKITADAGLGTVTRALENEKETVRRSCPTKLEVERPRGLVYLEGLLLFYYYWLSLPHAKVG